MFGYFTELGGRPSLDREIGLEIDDIRKTEGVGETMTTLWVDDHNGGTEIVRLRMPHHEVIRKINALKLYMASYLAADAQPTTDEGKQ